MSVQDTNSQLSLQYVKESKDYITDILNLEIQNIIKKYGSCSINDLILAVHARCPELKEFCQKNKSSFKITSVKDKGLAGKIVEYYLFGNLPNNDSCPDMIYGDVKATHFKKFGKSGKTFNAKERLTLTNFGDPSKQSNIDLIADKNSLQETQYYTKIKNGIILIFEKENEQFDTIESYDNKKILGILLYDLDFIFEKHPDIKDVFQTDFHKIKNCILQQKVTQAGQQYLHIHKHGCKNGITRAFGFTNKFLTKLVSICLKIPLLKSGRSSYIEF